MERSPSSVEKAALLMLGGLGYGALMFVWFALPAYLQPLGDELGLTGTQVGILAGAVPLTYIPLGLASGLVIDRIGARIGVGAGVALAGVAQVGRAYAADYPSMLALTLVMGIGATGVTFGMPKLAAELYPADRVSQAAAAYLIGSYAGSAGVFALGRSVLGPALGGWRPLFAASGVGALLIATVWAAAARYVPPGDHDTEAEGTFSLPSLAADVRAVLRHRDVRLLVVLGTMYLFVLHATQGWLVSILETRGITPGLAGRVTSLLVVGQVGGVLAIPVVAEWLDRTRASLAACGTIACVGALGLLAEPAAVGLLAAPVMLVGFGMGGLSPLVRAVPVELEGIGPGLTGTAVGLVFAVGEAGGFLGPVVVGALRDVTGSFTPGLIAVAACTLVAAGAGASISDLD